MNYLVVDKFFNLFYSISISNCMSYPLYLGVAGNSTSGKNYFLDILKTRLPADTCLKIYGFADSLKYDLRQFIETNFQIDIFNPTPEEKELIRPIMVAFASAKRRLNPDYFIEKLEHFLPKKWDDNKSIIGIQDVRFTNEFEWLRKRGGLLVYIQKFTIKEHKNGDYPSDFEMILTPPANKLEEENNEFLMANSDYQIAWPHGNIEAANRCVDNFIRFLEENKLWN